MARKKSSTRSEKSSTECTGEIIPKKRGRPRKTEQTFSSARTNTECTGLKKRRGRPPKNKVYTETSITDMSDIKKLTLLGYCSNTECTCSITDGDFEEGKKTFLVCIRCGTRQRISELRKEIEKIRPTSRKDFLNDNDDDTEDFEAYHHEVIIPKEFHSYQVDDNSITEWDS